MRELSQNDLAVFLDLLEQAAERFGNDGCNDYELDDTPENRALLHRSLESDDELILHKGKLCANNSILFDYFVECVREHANDLKNSPQNLIGGQA